MINPMRQAKNISIQTPSKPQKFIVGMKAQLMIQNTRNVTIPTTIETILLSLLSDEIAAIAPRSQEKSKYIIDNFV